MGSLSAMENQVRPLEELTDWVMNIAGFNLAVTVDDPAVGKTALRLYRSFVTKADPVFDIKISVRPEMAGSKPRSIRTQSDGIVYSVDSYNFSGQLDLSRSCATFSIAPDWEALDAVLRVVISIVLATNGGLLIHASSVALRGNAFIFPARPEGGKSTIAKLLSDDQVIGDELVAIGRDHNTYTVYGTPFWNSGPMSSYPPLQAPAKAICLINKADYTSICKLKPVAMAAKMMPHIFHDPKNRETNRVTLNALAGITEAISCYDLKFSLDAKDLKRCLDEID
jgi:hypothetical protein